MKVIAINGSPRKNGNTATMLQKILDGAAEKGAETRMIHLNALDMKGCQGCLECREKLGECAYDDDFQEVLKEMKECDAVALVTSQGDESREAYKHVIEYLQLLLSFLSGSTLEVITQAGTEDKTDARNDARLMQAARAVGKSLAL